MIYLAEQGDYYYMAFTEHMPSVGLPGTCLIAILPDRDSETAGAMPKITRLSGGRV